MNKGPILLAAGVPWRHLETYVPDPIAVRHAVQALVAVTVTDRLLIAGIHPDITPMVVHDAQCLDAFDNVRLYGSSFFKGAFPPPTGTPVPVVWTEEVPGDRDLSLKVLYEEMIRSQPFVAAFFMGGMEGVEEEWAIFRRECPAAAAFPIASTEGAARLLWRTWPPPELSYLPYTIKYRLSNDIDYHQLFRDLLGYLDDDGGIGRG